MTVDLKPESGGRWHFSLGPVEKSVVGILTTGVMAMTWWLVASVQTLLTQQAVTNDKLQTITAQLSGVPELGTRVSRLEVQAEQNKQDIRELKQLREVKR